MKWFIVVVMMWQPSGHTPLWIPYVSFETQDECMVHAIQNQYVIFQKAIEAPESRTSDDEEKIYGKAATAFLEKWTNAGDLTLKTFKEGKGKYGRILGELWFGGTHNINQILVDNHHAVRYHGQSKEEIAEEHIANRAKLNLTNEE